MDPILECLFILIGAMLAYLIDEKVQITPRIAEWLARVGPNS